MTSAELGSTHWSATLRNAKLMALSFAACWSVFALPLFAQGIQIIPQQGFGAPPRAVDPATEDPQRRRTLQLIYDTERLLRERQYLSAVEAFDAAWELAVRGEDPLLTLNSDQTARLRPGEHRVQAGARARLEVVFREAPQEFRSAWNEQVGQLARQAWKQVSDSRDSVAIRAFVLRYQFTDVAREAQLSLVKTHISRASYFEAALEYGRLLRLRGDTSAADQARLAVLWWKAGIVEEAVDHLRMAVSQADGATIKLDGNNVMALPRDTTTVALGTWLALTSDSVDAVDATGPPQLTDLSQWLQPEGTLRRTGRQMVGPPLLNREWSQRTMESLQHPSLTRILAPLGGVLQQQAVARLRANLASIPAGAPIVVDNLLIYRCAGNIQAVDRTTGELQWESFPLDRYFAGLVQPHQPSTIARNMEQNDSLVRQIIFESLRSHLVRSVTSGQLATDGHFVFAVENVVEQSLSAIPGQPLLSPVTPTNVLRLYDVRTGQLRAQVGGTTVTSNNRHPLNDCYFLGVPLIMGRRAYVIAESDQGVFLHHLQIPSERSPLGEMELKLVHSQLLTIPRLSLQEHPARAVCGISPSAARGLLLCATCDAQIVAVSAEDHAVRWIHRYATNVTAPEANRGIFTLGGVRDNRMSRRLDEEVRWLDALPRIASDRVFLTPRDSNRLICLDLATGRELWTRTRGRMRKIVAVDDKQVVVTGTDFVTCLDAETGAPKWTTSLDAAISGNSVATNGLLQVPIVTGKIVAVNLQDGHTMVSQSLENHVPGNLVSAGNRLYSQNMASVSCWVTPDAQRASPLAVATQLLLQGEDQQAQTILQQAVDSTTLPESQALQVRELLVSSLIESLRTDFDAHADRVPLLRKLIDEVGTTQDQLMSAALAMIGMSPGELTSLPSEWADIHHLEKYRDELIALESRRTLSDPDATPAEVAQVMMASLRGAHTDWDKEITKASIVRTAPRSTAAAIGEKLYERPADQRVAIIEELNELLGQTIRSAATADDAAWWVELSLWCGLRQPAVNAALDSRIRFPRTTDSLLREFALMSGTEVRESELRRAAFDGLQTLWREHERSDLLHSMVRQTEWHRAGTAIVTDTLQCSVSDRLVAPSETTITAKDFEDARDHRPWPGVPIVAPTAAHSAERTFPGRVRAHSPRTNVPLFGKPGCFAGWQFLQMQNSMMIHAWDAAGRHRWVFDPGTVAGGRTSFGGYQRLSRTYAVAVGNLIIFKIHDVVLAVDGSRDSPKMLWRKRLPPTTNPSELQNMWERSTQYDVQPTGLAPVGPASLWGIPVFSQRELSLLHPLTGRRQWRISGLPEDSTLSADDETVCVISAATGEIQVRRLTDGEFLMSHPLPPWWIDASENSSMSVRDADVEPGRDDYWRITVQQNQCLLLRRNPQESALESFDLRRGQIRWSIPLPADSVVSNIVEGRVAVLSNGTELKMFDLIAGRQLCRHTVAAAPQSRQLYLRSSGGQWLILTHVYDPEWDWSPVNSSVQVNGPVYAVSQSDWQLTWQREIQRQSLRILSPDTSGLPPIPSAVPVLMLLKKPVGPRRANGLMGPAIVQGLILDSRTGDVLFDDSDLGRQLSFHGIDIDDKRQRIEFSFNKRNVVLTYGQPASAPPNE